MVVRKKVVHCIAVAVAVLLCLSSSMKVFAADTYDSGSGTVSDGGYTLDYSWSTTYEKANSTQSGSNNGGSGSVSLSDTKFTLKAKSSYYKAANIFNWTTYIVYNYSTRLTITNSGAYGCKITYNTSGNLGNVTGAFVELAKGESATFTLATTTAADSTKAQDLSGVLTITGIEVYNKTNVSFASSEYGAYKYSVGGIATTVEANANQTVHELAAGAEVTLECGNVAEGYVFYGWMANGSLLSTKSTYVYSVSVAVEIYPVFVSREMNDAGAPFKVGSNSHMYWHLAMEDAVASGNAVVLTRDYTLPTTLKDNGLHTGHKFEGYISNGTSSISYIIPANVTFLIPCDKENTVYTTVPGNDGDDKYTEPSVYRKLTMEDGVNIIVNGAISVAGKQGTAMGPAANGAPSGPLGYIDMAFNSSITVNSGANLYAWGYIIGSGSVTVNNGGSVYEDFQITDWRGGSVTSGMLGNDQKVFPLSQYYVQNIQVPLTLAAGAKEKVCTAVTISYVGVQNPNPTFIGSGGLFVLSSGTLTKDYDENTDQTIFTVDGDISFSNLQISLKLGVLGTKTINSKDYVMPIRSGMIVNVSSGSTVSMNQDVALVPGAELNIAENATVTFGNGNSLYVYDADNWGRFCYYSSQDRTYYPVIYVPTGRADRSAGLSTDAKMLINGTVDASAGGFYTTAGGANIYSTGSGKVVMGTNSATATYQYSQVADSDDGHGEKAYISIPITTAKLRNDVNRYGESYTVTAGSTGSTTYTYDLISGTWGTKEVTVVPVYNGVADTNNAETGYALDSSAELAGYYSDATLKTPATEISGGSTVYRLAAATIIDGGSIEGYTKLSSAVKDYQNSGYIQMQQIGSEPGYIVDKDIILDLNKCDVYVGGATATIKGIDSGTNGYECADENLGSLSGVAADKIASTATVNGKHYLAITESDKTTFHRVAVSLTRYALKNPHLIVEGTFRGTTAAYDKLSDMGFNFDKNIVAPDPNNAEKTVETNNVWFGKKPAETTTGSGSTTVQFSFSAAAGTDYEVTPQMKLLTIALDKNNNPVYDILSGTKRTISIQAVLDAIAPPTTEEGV